MFFLTNSTQLSSTPDQLTHFPKFLQKNIINTSQALDYLSQLSYTLMTLHSNRIVHLDISESNIFINHYKKVVLVNFKNSQVLSSPYLNECKGTLRKLSPQANLKVKNPTRLCNAFKTDVYALGITMLNVIFTEPIMTLVTDYDGFIKNVDWTGWDELKEVIFGMLENNESERWSMKKINFFVQSLIGTRLALLRGSEEFNYSGKLDLDMIDTSDIGVNSRSSPIILFNQIEREIDFEFINRVSEQLSHINTARIHLILSEALNEEIAKILTRFNQAYPVTLESTILQETLFGYIEFIVSKSLSYAAVEKKRITLNQYFELQDMLYEVERLWKKIIVDFGNGLMKKNDEDAIKKYRLNQRILNGKIMRIYGMEQQNFQNNELSKIQDLIENWCHQEKKGVRI